MRITYVKKMLRIYDMIKSNEDKMNKFVDVQETYIESY